MGEEEEQDRWSPNRPSVVGGQKTHPRPPQPRAPLAETYRTLHARVENLRRGEVV